VPTSEAGRAIAGRVEYREVLLEVLGGTYALQYHHDGGPETMH
jgi:hypothetical protein